MFCQIGNEDEGEVEADYATDDHQHYHSMLLHHDQPECDAT